MQAKTSKKIQQLNSKNSSPYRLSLVLGLSLSVGVVGCESLSSGAQTTIGALSGAVVGGVIGHQINDKNGRYVGAAIGGLAGGLLGNYISKQQQILEKEVAKYGIGITRIDDKTLKVNIPEELSFDFNKSNLKPGFSPILSKIAQVMKDYPHTVIQTYGFTDSKGSDDYNLKLSQKRAISTASFIAGQSVMRERLLIAGLGETYPVASNDDDAGRGKNRRVEIYIKAVEEGKEAEATIATYPVTLSILP